MHETTMVTVPVVVGVVAAVRQATGLPSRYLPLCSLVAGIAAALLLIGPTGSAAAEGLLTGLAASGLYSGTRAVLR